MLNWSHRKFAHVTTVTLSWQVQDFVVIGRVHYKPEHGKLWLLGRTLGIVSESTGASEEIKKDIGKIYC